MMVAWCARKARPMTARPHWIFATLAALWLTSCADVPADVPADKSSGVSRLDQAALLTASCSGCHVPGGSAQGIVSLEGRSAGEIQASLLAYRNDTGGGSAMHRMARGYTEQQNHCGRQCDKHE